MWRSWVCIRRFCGVIGVWLAVSSCGRAAPAAPTAVSLAPTATATAVPATATATQTPTSTPTPLPTPTPTATAVSLTISGDPRAVPLAVPAPNGRFACGVVDVLDFPIDPPDATHVSRGGGDFGLFRSRYDKFHAGEDWGGVSGRPNLGTAVYSIGHGLVTYAEPLGWGRDQGVVIVQHTFADGRILLSFYGHLEPTSIGLTPGACVARGQQVGEIGQPRGFPHLHFEIRTQSPYAPLTGYWPEDPTTQGWLWPSQTIWQARLAAAPGVVWTRPFTANGSAYVGQLDQASIVLRQGGQLIALDLATGAERPLALGGDEESRVADAVRHPQQPTLFVAGLDGAVAAFSLVDGVPQSQWQQETDASAPQLLPLPDGGVLVLGRSDWLALAADGTRRWHTTTAPRMVDWALSAEHLYLTTSGADAQLWRLDGERPLAIAALSGKLALTAGRLWLYSANGVYWLDTTEDAATPELLLPLPTGTLSRGDVVALPTGGALLAHSDGFDRRLILLDANGRLVWERSFAGQLVGEQRLVVWGDRPYLVSQLGSGAAGGLNVYAVDLTAATLTHIFSGGSRTPYAPDMWATAVADGLLLNVGGGPMGLLQPDMALAMITAVGE